jgi:hypothetical protein
MGRRELGRVRVRAEVAESTGRGTAAVAATGTGEAGGRSSPVRSAGAAIGAAAGAGAGETAAGGGAGAGAAGAGEGRGGSNVSGSTYPFGSSARLMPRWTYGTSTSGSPDGPIVPTGSPSATPSPALTAIAPRWSRVTAKPSDVLSVSVRPFPGSQPANDTLPSAGASTVAPASPPMSIPLWPCSWYSAPPNSNPRSTGPSAGQLQAAAGDAATSPSAITVRIVVVFFVNIDGERSRPGRLLSKLATETAGKACSAERRSGERRRRRPSVSTDRRRRARPQPVSRPPRRRRSLPCSGRSQS